MKYCFIGSNTRLSFLDTDIFICCLVEILNLQEVLNLPLFSLSYQLIVCVLLKVALHFSRVLMFIVKLVVWD